MKKNYLKSTKNQKVPKVEKFKKVPILQKRTKLQETSNLKGTKYLISAKNKKVPKVKKFKKKNTKNAKTYQKYKIIQKY